MRELSLAELDAVSGGRAGWDSCDYNSEIGINMPIEDHGAYAEAQAKAGFISLWASAQAKEQLDSFAKSVGLPNFPELQRQAAIHQQQTCQVDPTFTAMMRKTTVLANAITTIRGAFCSERTRRVATTRIHKIETGIKTFQPNCMNWSYRKRGKVPRSHTNTKKNVRTFKKNQIAVNQPPSQASVNPSPGGAL